jgi:hypothetical protein
MKLISFLKSIFDKFVDLGMDIRPAVTVWLAEVAFKIAPDQMRGVVNRLGQRRLFACVVGGELPMIPQLQGGDAVLFYPLAHCERYVLLEHPELTPTPLFEGKILAIIIPPEKRQSRYQVCGYDAAGKCYPTGPLSSHGKDRATQISAGVRVQGKRISWPVQSKRYLVSFIMLHSGPHAHAAVYSQKKYWDFPQTKTLPLVVVPPDGTELGAQGTRLFTMVVERDAWVPHMVLFNDETVG